MPVKMLTDTALRNLKPKDKPYKVTVGEGLYLLVSPTGGKLWRMNYRHNGKQKTLAIGGYPAVSLKSAKEQRDKANELRAAGVDPSEEKKTIKDTIKADETQASATFKNIAIEWHSTYTQRLSPVHAAKLKRYLEEKFFPSLGGILVNEITPAMVLSVSKPVEKKGHICTAHKLTRLAGQVLEYARLKGLLMYNVAVGLNKALVPDSPNSHPTLTDPQQIGRLLLALEEMDATPSVYAFMNILPMVFTRQTELRTSKWHEFDLENRIWTIPASRMKIKGRRDFVVPLSTQVMVRLTALRPFTGGGPDDYVFPAPRGNSRPLSLGTGKAVLRSLGYTAEQQTMHGFRAMASTLLNEQGYRPDVIETCLAHGDPDKVRGIYNRAEYLEERTTLMQEWADYLDGLKTKEADKRKKK